MICQPLAGEEEVLIDERVVLDRGDEGLSRDVVGGGDRSPRGDKLSFFAEKPQG